jgi:hypothetical protein
MINYTDVTRVELENVDIESNRVRHFFVMARAGRISV